MKNSAIFKQLTGLAATFAVGKELVLRGYYIALTQKNFPLVDLFATDPRTMKSVPIQVKGAREERGFDLEIKKTRLPNLVVVFVVLRNRKNVTDFYVVKASEARKFIGGAVRPGISFSDIKKWHNNWKAIRQCLS